MRRNVFWRLFVILSLGVVIFFSLLHSAAILSNEKMSYIDDTHQQEIRQWGAHAQRLLDEGDTNKLDTWLNDLAIKENTWATVIRSQIDDVAGNPLNERFWQGYGIGRSETWKIHLYFPENPIMEVALTPSNHHFLIILPDRMRPGTYMSHAFWFYRVVVPFMALFALTLYIYRYVMTPLKHFHSTIMAFSRGNYQARIADRVKIGDDEFGQVAKTFDAMAERTSTVIEHNKNLIADMSHEIRTPLARIEMAVDCVEHDVNPKLMVDRVRTEVSQMRQLAEDTLTLAWIENEQPDLRVEPFDLSELLEAIVDDARFEFPDRHLDLDVPYTLPVAKSSQRAVGHAIENIIRNGLRYTPKDQPLRIEARLEKDQIRLRVIDSGPGIDPNLCDRIFTPFFKADNNVGTRKGFGVGLALAKRHIEAVKGSVFASNNRNQGMVFTVLLPT
ncbi:sensor histidine kinase [uncultured Vibrio sp.]|uniref:sensor histidine kinase n=1 Tax=uncultured Vibrio sp. TaxID=114054 RepID=UPI0025E0C5BD|nr:sensor histidine kinase [uncultured Vibrio sp.]